jgi:hypothetical protein
MLLKCSDFAFVVKYREDHLEVAFQDAELE